MSDIYDALYSNLKIPKVLIAEVVDRGYHDFTGIEMGCFVGVASSRNETLLRRQTLRERVGNACALRLRHENRVLLGFACARFDCLRDILDCEVGLNQEVIQSLILSGAKMVFPYQKICLICESLDIKNILQ